MIEIAPHLRPPLATVLAVVVPLLVGAAVLLRRTPASVRRRLLVAAAAGAVLLTAASAVVWSRRHAGTGTETARGWPRIVHSRWESFEGEEGRSGIHWRGVLEGMLVYAVAGAAVLGVGHAVRRRRAGGDGVERRAPT